MVMRFGVAAQLLCAPCRVLAENRHNDAGYTDRCRDSYSAPIAG
jgi:hypothetical protein